MSVPNQDSHQGEGPSPAPSPARTGACAAALGYTLWGLVPLYWKQLEGIGSLELIGHRVVWSLLLLLALTLPLGGGREIVAALGNARSFGRNFLSATLLTVNWLVYVWGVNTGHVVECSLGYFLVPLFNVAVGRFVLHEQLRRVQWLAVACAAAGVGVMIGQLGRLPWIALVLAATWGAYGLMRKNSPLGSLNGLTVETLLFAPAAILFLLWQDHTGAGALGRTEPRLHALILSAGLVTALPLLLFAYGARRIRLSTLGLLQYIAPTVQLAIGVWYYHEPFARSRALGFAFIWVGLAIYTTDNLVSQRTPK